MTGKVRSVLFGDGSEVIVDLLLREDSELRVLLRYDGDFEVSRLEIERKDGLQCVNGEADELGLRELQVFTAELLLQKGGSFLLLRSAGSGAVSGEVSGGIDFEELGAKFLVHTD